MTEVLERQGIIANLITLHKDNQKNQELLMAILVQMCTLNILTRKLARDQGFDFKTTVEDMDKEIKTAMDFIEKRFTEIDKMSKLPALAFKRD